MKLKIFSLIAGALLLFSANAYAFLLDVQLDAGHGGYAGTATDADTLTDPWQEVSLIADTATTQFDPNGNNAIDVGENFIDAGHARWINYSFLALFSPGDTEGLAQAGGYDITIEWTDVTGYVNQISGTGPINHNLTYTGGTFDFYFDPTADSSLGSTSRLSDDVGFDGGGGDEIHFMTIGELTGTGTNTFDASGNYLSGSSQFTGKVLTLDSGYLFEYPSGLDLDTYVNFELLFSEVNQNTQQTGIIQELGLAGSGELFTVYSKHDGSMSFEVVPEPTTMFLFGTGLLGLAGLSRRKFAKKS